MKQLKIEHLSDVIDNIILDGWGIELSNWINTYTKVVEKENAYWIVDRNSQITSIMIICDCKVYEKILCVLRYTYIRQSKQFIIDIGFVYDSLDRTPLNWYRQNQEILPFHFRKLGENSQPTRQFIRLQEYKSISVNKEIQATMSARADYPWYGKTFKVLKSQENPKLHPILKFTYESLSLKSKQKSQKK